jgi:hypothetical protein
VSGLYRFPAGVAEGQHVWIVDGSVIRREVYPEFLYGGNPQRYRYIPPGQIWVDNAIAADEYSYTVAHELYERALMARKGMTYAEAHDSALALERRLRDRDWHAARRHEASLPRVAPTDCDGVREISSLKDSVRLHNVYRAPLGIREGIRVWIVDGAAVRRDIYPDFGQSGNGIAYHFIPEDEIWIDGQVSCEETEFSIAAELKERSLMVAGAGYDDAYEEAIKATLELRNDAARAAARMPAVSIPSPPDREKGRGDEK